MAIIGPKGLVKHLGEAVVLDSSSKLKRRNLGEVGKIIIAFQDSRGEVIPLCEGDGVSITPPYAKTSGETGAKGDSYIRGYKIKGLSKRD